MSTQSRPAVGRYDAKVIAGIREQRLRNQLITKPSAGRPESIVRWLGAVQAQEYGPAKWGIGLRAASAMTDVTIERAIEQGRILRTHLLRPTWHFVAREDIRWIVDLTGPHVHRTMSSYDRQLGLDGPLMTRAAAVIERALGQAGYLTRRELGTHLARANLPSKSRELAHIVMYAELEGLICSGPRRGNQFTYALLAERAPAALRLQRDEALAELTQRYFRSHGPATIRDFVWWSGLKTSDAKRGLEMNRAKSLEVDGLKYWTLGRSEHSGGIVTPTVQLLPIYDEYLVAYRDHRAVPRPAYVLGSFQHAVVSGGQVIGSWRAVPTSEGVVLDPVIPKHLTAVERRGLAQIAARYGKFLDVPVSVTRQKDRRRSLRH